MSDLVLLDEDVLVKRGVEALMRELGPVEAIRFIALQSRDTMDSVGRHQRWQDSIDAELVLEAVLAELDAAQAKRSE